MKIISSKLKYTLSPYDLIRLANEYKKQDKDFNDKVIYLLTDLNFHSECSDFINNKTDKIISESRFEIRKILEHYVLNKFVAEYNSNPKNSGYLSFSSEALNDVSEYECKYLEYEGYICPTKNGYELTNEFIKAINSNKKFFKDKRNQDYGLEV